MIKIKHSKRMPKLVLFCSVLFLLIVHDSSNFWVGGGGNQKKLLSLDYICWINM